MGIIAGCLLQDHDEHGTNFQQLPYHRLLLILFLDMNMAEPVLENMNFQVSLLYTSLYKGLNYFNQLRKFNVIFFFLKGSYCVLPYLANHQTQHRPWILLRLARNGCSSRLYQQSFGCNATAEGNITIFFLRKIFFYLFL